MFKKSSKAMTVGGEIKVVCEGVKKAQDSILSDATRHIIN